MASVATASHSFIAMVSFSHQSLEYSKAFIDDSYTWLSSEKLPICNSDIVCDESVDSNNKGNAETVQNKDEMKQSTVISTKDFEYLIHMDAYHAGYLTQSMTQSAWLCKGFLNIVKLKTRRPQRFKFKPAYMSKIRNRTERPILVDTMVTVKLTEPEKEWIDYKWNYRILDFVTKKALLEDAMAWLNTLGGGYSALGDYFEHHARQAGRISLKQFKLALDIGDPTNVIRCRLYYSLSLMQTGQLEKAAILIRWQYHFAKNLPVKDHRLLSMCKGIWSRLQFFHKHQKRSKLKTFTNGHVSKDKSL